MTRDDVVSTATGVSRRTMMRTLGAGLLVPAVAGVAAAKPGHGRGTTPPAGLTSWGEAATFGGGTVRTLATVMPTGEPAFVGVWMEAAVLDGVPATGGPVPLHLHLPDDHGTNFTFVGLDWNPAGHPPAGVYDEPHFDVHFYLMDEADVASIPGGVATYDLPADQTPANNVFATDVGAPVREVVPGMGEHLVDVSAPEFGGHPFTHTLIWGAYDPAMLEGPTDGVGELTFVEPMLTAAFLETHPNVTVPMNLPATFPTAGYYPTAYAVRYLPNADAYVVLLGDFEYFPASDGVVAA